MLFIKINIKNINIKIIEPNPSIEDYPIIPQYKIILENNHIIIKSTLYYELRSLI